MDNSDQNEKKIVIGRFNSVYGIKGWLKIFSHTQPMENIFSYSPWYIKDGKQWRPLEVSNWRKHGKGIVALIKGIDDREVAKELTGKDVFTFRDQLPKLEEGDFYWTDLEGLAVLNEEGVVLGKVHHLFETGSNDVLVVKPNKDSVDDRERLIPYLPEQTVLQVDLAKGEIQVDWDPEF